MMRRAREWRTALVSASCAMPMISRSTPSPKRGSSSTTRSIGTSVVALPEIGEALERRRDVFAAADVRTQRADRSPRFGQVRARQVDGGLDARPRPPAAACRASRCAA